MAGNDQGASQGVVGKVCPKCHYARKPTDTAPDWQCPACGIAYIKVEPSAAKPDVAPSAPTHSAPTAEGSSDSPSGVVNATPAAADPGISKKKVIATALICLVVGYFAGREHLKYEVRNAIGSAFSGVASGFNNSPSKTSPALALDMKSETQQNAVPPTVEPAPMTATLLSKKFVPSNPSVKRYEDYIAFRLRFDNLSDRDIRAFQGVIKFYDLLDNLILAANVAINDPVDANSSLEWPGQIDYNQFRDSHQGLRNAEMQNMKVRFQTEKILFNDGTVKEFH